MACECKHGAGPCIFHFHVFFPAQNADDLIACFLAAILGKRQVLNKGKAQAKTITKAFFESAHAYALEHFPHCDGGSCRCPKCLGCRCRACKQQREEEVAMQQSKPEPENEESDSEMDVEEEKKECEICGKKVKDMVLHNARVHPGAAAPEEGDDEERNLLQARLQEAEKAEQRAAAMALQAQQEKAAAEAKAEEMARVASQLVLLAQPPAGGAVDEDADMPPPNSPAQPDGLAPLLHPDAKPNLNAANLNPDQSPKEEKSVVSTAQRKELKMQLARPHVQSLGPLIRDKMLQYNQQTLVSDSTRDMKILETTLSYVPGAASSKTVAPREAIALYKEQSRFGRKMDLRTRYSAGCLARQFNSHEGGPSLTEAANARIAAAGKAMIFDKFCPAILGADPKIVRAEIYFSLLCDTMPGLLPALIDYAAMFSWTDFVNNTTGCYLAWREWVQEEARLHLQDNSSSSGSDSDGTHKRKAEADDDADTSSAKKQRIDAESKAATRKEEASFRWATAHLQTIRRYDPPLIAISDFVDLPAFRNKQLHAVRYSETDLHDAIDAQRAYLATDAPVMYQSALLPPASELLSHLRGCLGTTIEKVDFHEGETRNQWFFVKAVLDTWHKSGSEYLPTEELSNIVNGRADDFVKRFVFAGLDQTNALRAAKKDLRSVTLSPRGAWTNTHYDDHTGVTLYLTGLKLWMFLDAAEVKQHSGIPDTASASESERKVKASLSFSLPEFLKMEKSWWALTGPGHLLVVPEGMFHRVVTLEPTFGVTFNYERSRDTVAEFTKPHYLKPTKVSKLIGASEQVEYVWEALQVVPVPGKGEGVRARVSLPKGTCLPVHANVIPDDPYPTDTTYILDIGKKGFLLDMDPAHAPSNQRGLFIAGKVNEPSKRDKREQVNMVAVFDDGKPVFRAVEDIAAGDELLVDYGRFYDRSSRVDT